MKKMHEKCKHPNSGRGFKFVLLNTYLMSLKDLIDFPNYTFRKPRIYIYH